MSFEFSQDSPKRVAGKKTLPKPSRTTQKKRDAFEFDEPDQMPSPSEASKSKKQDASKLGALKTINKSMLEKNTVKRRKPAVKETAIPTEPLERLSTPPVTKSRTSKASKKDEASLTQISETPPSSSPIGIKMRASPLESMSLSSPALSPINKPSSLSQQESSPVTHGQQQTTKPHVPSRLAASQTSSQIVEEYMNLSRIHSQEEGLLDLMTHRAADDDTRESSIAFKPPASQPIESQTHDDDPFVFSHAHEDETQSQISSLTKSPAKALQKKKKPVAALRSEWEERGREELEKQRRFFEDIEQFSLEEEVTRR